jgi:Protein of unknown function (DUF4197)
MVRSFVLCVSIFSSSSVVHAQLDQIEKRLGMGNASSLSDSKVTSDLKEALRVGASNSVKLIGKTDAYFNNEAIKILMPSNLSPLEKGLRAVGFGPKIDSSILSMNRSAETAAPVRQKDFHQCHPRDNL